MFRKYNYDKKRKVFTSWSIKPHFITENTQFFSESASFVAFTFLAFHFAQHLLSVSSYLAYNNLQCKLNVNYKSLYNNLFNKNVD